jgi:hypothetical protein
MLEMALPGYAGDGAATQGCTGCGKAMQPPNSEHRDVVATRRSQIGKPIIVDIRVGV